MKRLNLDAFKAKISAEEIQKTETLIGSILGDCHVWPTNTAPGSQDEAGCENGYIE